MEIAILDLGSTSFHLEHFSFSPRGALEVTLDIKQPLSFGKQVFTDGQINPQSWAEGLEAVGSLLEQSRLAKPTHTVAFATSAMRTARNGRLFAHEVRRAFGIDVQILAPQAEATYAYLGASACHGVGGRRALVADLGGGSLELALGAGTQCDAAMSLPLGAVRMCQTVSGSASFNRAAWQRLVPIVRTHLAQGIPGGGDFPPELLAFASGTTRAARKLAMRESDIPGKAGLLDATALRMCLGHFVDAAPEELLQAGVPENRAQTVLVAAAVMLEIMDHLGFSTAVTVDRGLRDGVALAHWRGQRTTTATGSTTHGNSRKDGRMASGQYTAHARMHA